MILSLVIMQDSQEKQTISSLVTSNFFTAESPQGALSLASSIHLVAKFRKGKSKNVRDYSLLPMIRIKIFSPQRTQRTQRKIKAMKERAYLIL
ncbi:MAG: hypothetical protein CO187_07510 [Zetaproteobacteria bacterium CG_4_9_14_3_um_filter_53_7]|nr:MAG: hypothetical protein CO187_07510 [Zetaproteobacteria bacterium CG_4_9_14_3_um_filter_53_7]